MYFDYVVTQVILDSNWPSSGNSKIYYYFQFLRWSLHPVTFGTWSIFYTGDRLYGNLLRILALIKASYLNIDASFK